MHGEGQHADRRPLAVALGERDERMHLALPRPLRPRRACLRCQPAVIELVVAADIAERVERRQDDVQALIAQSASRSGWQPCSFDAAPGPAREPLRAEPCSDVSDSALRM